jgi:hypothetical protein
VFLHAQKRSDHTARNFLKSIPMLASKHSFRLLSKKRIIPAHTDPKPEKKEFDTTHESDSKKRSFLKLAGIVGVGALATSMLPRKADAIVFGANPGPSATGLKNSAGAQINPATEDTLQTVANQTNLLTFDSTSNPANLKVNIAAISSSADIGIQNASNVTINPATQETLAAISAVTSQMQFTGGALLTSVGGTGNIVGVKDTTNTQVNPATDDSLVYLRRMVKLMESQAAVDASNRQRVTVDSFGNTVTGVGASGAGIPRVTVSNDSNFLATISTLNGWNDQMFQDPARNAYANGIRYNLVFS